MSEVNLSAGTLEEQLKEGFLDGLDFSPETTDRVKVFTQAGENAGWIPYQNGALFTPQAALPILVERWNAGYGLKVEIKVQLSGDLDADVEADGAP